MGLTSKVITASSYKVRSDRDTWPPSCRSSLAVAPKSVPESRVYKVSLDSRPITAIELTRPPSCRSSRRCASPSRPRGTRCGSPECSCSFHINSLSGGGEGGDREGRGGRERRGGERGLHPRNRQERCCVQNQSAEQVVAAELVVTRALFRGVL